MVRPAAKKCLFYIPVALAAGIFFSCSNKMEEIQQLSNTSTLPERTILHANFLFTENGDVQNQLTAGKLEQFESPDSVYTLISDGFKLTFYNDSQQVKSVLTAMNAVLLGQNFSVMIARDSVVFQNDQQEVLRTEELIYQQDSNKVFTDNFVTIEQADAIIYGNGLISNSDFSDYEILQPTGVIYLDEK